MVRKQCKLKRSIPSLFQSIVQVSLSHSQRAPTTIAPIIFIIAIVFVIGITVSCVNLTDSTLLLFQVKHEYWVDEVCQANYYCKRITELTSRALRRSEFRAISNT